MTGFDLHRYVAKETAASVVVNLLVSTVPSLLATDFTTTGAFRPVREVAMDLAPGFFMAALMSALAPLLLTCWKQARGRLGIASPRLRPERAAVIAVGLAIMSTIVVLALIHAIVAPLAASGLDAGAILALRGAQATFAAATVTPAAILLLFGRFRPRTFYATATNPLPWQR